jgi:signal transduction histidine kinase
VLNVTEVARTAIETMRPQANERSITIELRADEVVNMTADRSEIEIIFNNLVSNAVKYNRDGGRVDVGISAEGEAVVITVSDTGIGMTTEECGKLFQDFVRIKNKKTKNILGSGLGLSTVRKLAHLYGGDAEVTSQAEVGTTFTVRLKRYGASQTGENESAGSTGVAAAG